MGWGLNRDKEFLAMIDCYASVKSYIGIEQLPEGTKSHKCAFSSHLSNASRAYAL